ncbi:UbiA family prenyltransferase [Tenacibaculum soleae]|uniref:UbiA family prenyltransferase n=1 Tax=Tenacibaculum soleae TaxID=447689 RepID=UPI0026E129D7|nr:UbiA family prenyltransferase [Tenacibaculum soleae]MDO6812274.1 UbiA family prenyltransferase [Tenacibaculum soleae]
MKILEIFFNVIEWKRLLYFSFIIFLVKYCFLYGFGFETTLSFVDITIFTFSCMLFYISIYILKHYYHNKISINSQNLKIISSLCLVLGFLSGVCLSFKIQKPYFSFLFLFCAITAIVFSKYTEKNSFLSHLIKSFLLPFTILCVWAIDTPINLTTNQWNIFFKLQFITMVYLLLSFISTLIEETIKGITTINEDNLNKRKTMSILLGRKRAKSVILSMMFFSAILILFLAFSLKKSKYLFITIILSNLLPQVYTMYLLTKATTNKSYRSLLKRMKALHAFGIMGVIAIAYYFKYVI